MITVKLLFIISRINEIICCISLVLRVYNTLLFSKQKWFGAVGCIIQGGASADAMIILKSVQMKATTVRLFVICLTV